MILQTCDGLECCRARREITINEREAGQKQNKTKRNTMENLFTIVARNNSDEVEVGGPHDTMIGGGGDNINFDGADPDDTIFYGSNRSGVAESYFFLMSVAFIIEVTFCIVLHRLKAVEKTVKKAAREVLGKSTIIVFKQVKRLFERADINLEGHFERAESKHDRRHKEQLDEHEKTRATVVDENEKTRAMMVDENEKTRATVVETGNAVMAGLRALQQELQEFQKGQQEGAIVLQKGQQTLANGVLAWKKTFGEGKSLDLALSYLTFVRLTAKVAAAAKDPTVNPTVNQSTEEQDLDDDVADNGYFSEVSI